MQRDVYEIGSTPAITQYVNETKYVFLEII